MKVAIISVTGLPCSSPVVAAFRQLAELYARSDRELTNDPERADCLLFVDLHLCGDPSLGALLEHPLVRERPGNVLVYDERDEPWCALPGVYVSMPAKYFDRSRQRAFSYYTLASATASDPTVVPDLLFSFIGTPGHRTSGGYRVRKSVLALRHPRGVVEDSSGFVFYDDQGDPQSHAARQRRFAQLVSRSKFVLCPRGRGTSSIRMYEALRGGRVPIVLADDWVEPAGPDWSAFSIRIPERGAWRVPQVLEEHESRWPEMSQAALDAFEQWFSPGVAVHRILDLCEDILRSRPVVVPPWRDASYRAMRVRTLRQSARQTFGAALRKARITR